MEILAVLEQITDARERMGSADEAAMRHAARLLAALQQELSNSSPESATEAFMMATELTYMLEEGGDQERAARVARSLTDGLMAMSKMELAEFEGLLERANNCKEPSAREALACSG